MRRRAWSVLGTVRFRIAVAPAVVPVRLAPRDSRLARCSGRLRVRAAMAGAHASSGEFLLLAR
jgi:hypothetical protein